MIGRGRLLKHFFKNETPDGIDDMGVFRRNEEEITWGAEREEFANGDDVMVEFCDSGYESSWSDYEVADGYTSLANSVSCDGKKVDMWSIDVEADATVAFAVDTVSSETAFDAKLTVLDSEGCVAAMADDNFPCAFAPDRYECPAIEVELEAGE